MAQERIIVTGQSGARVKSSIDGFIKNATPFAQGETPPKPFNLEEAMTDIYCESEKRPRHDRIWMDEILNLPASRLQDIWDQAFQSVLEKAGSEDLEGRPIILSFHACFYHQSTVEYLCFVRETLVEKFKPDVFVTLIDDVYDVHSRLREPKQMFSPSLDTGTVCWKHRPILV
jgi:adenylate kinase